MNTRDFGAAEPDVGEVILLSPAFHHWAQITDLWIKMNMVLASLPAVSAQIIYHYNI